MKLKTLRKNNVSDDLYLVYCLFPKREACRVNVFGEEDENGKFIGTGKKKLRGKMIKREGVFSGTHYHSLEWYKKARELQFKISGKCDLPEVSE